MRGDTHLPHDKRRDTKMLSRVLIGRLSSARVGRRYLSDAAADVASVPKRPVRKAVSLEEREALRQARRERAAKAMEQEGQGSATGGGSSGASSVLSPKRSAWLWYAGIGVPTVMLAWGIGDENSPPAKLSEMIGLTALIQSFSEDFAKPSHDKLLPDWSQVGPWLEVEGTV